MVPFPLLSSGEAGLPNIHTVLLLKIGPQITAEFAVVAAIAAAQASLRAYDAELGRAADSATRRGPGTRARGGPWPFLLKSLALAVLRLAAVLPVASLGAALGTLAWPGMGTSAGLVVGEVIASIAVNVGTKKSSWLSLEAS